MLIEKPLSDNLKKYEEASNTLLDLNEKIKIAYNLRYLNSMIFFKNFYENLLGKIYSVQSEVGQNLIKWRPKKNYKHTVSSNKKLGGGALLELSHELDYLTWIFATFKVFSANFLIPTISILMLKIMLNLFFKQKVAYASTYIWIFYKIKL